MSPDTLEQADQLQVRPFGFRKLQKLEHNRDNGHLFGFKYWHFFDIGTDIARTAIKPLNGVWQTVAEAHPERWLSKLLPASKIIAKGLPVVGVLGEAMHVYTPFQAARQDWQSGEISTVKFGGLCAVYAAYTITGLGGILTAGIKEGLTHVVKKTGAMPDRYIPHTLYEEFQHTGLIGGHEDHEHQHVNKVQRTITLQPLGALQTVCPSMLSELSPTMTPKNSNWTGLEILKPLING